VLDGSGTLVMVVVAVVVMMMMGEIMMNDVASKFITFAYRLGNDRCNGSSSKNECNGKLDLSHFLSDEM
jgi:hypothetical protein